MIARRAQGQITYSPRQMKELGFGLLASIALDATLIRILLVPSIMGLLGAANWWVPAPLRAWSTRACAFAEGDAMADPVQEGESAA